MAISTYDELKTEVGNWLERAGTTPVTSNVADWIQLGEGDLNLELRGIRKTKTVNTSLTGTASSRNIDISSLTDFLTAVSLVRTTNSEEKVLTKYVEGSLPRRTSNGAPNAWAISGDNIVLDAPCDQAHTFEFVYYKMLDVENDFATNWVLAKFPGVYLFKTLKYASAFFKDVAGAQGYDALAQDTIQKIRAADLKNDGSTLRVDVALQSVGGFNINTGDYG